MKLKDKLNTYTTSELREIGLIILDVTRKTLGHGNKPAPKFKIRNTLSGRYGQYDYEYNIYVNPTNCVTMEMFVRTIIHEYTHHIQKGLKSINTPSVIKNGYYDSPFEIEARGNELKYKSQVWKQVKSL